MNFRTPYNAKEFPKNHEVNNLPSETIPDQTLSVKQIMERFARGLPVDGEKVPVYNGEELFPDLDKLDLAERQMILEQTKEEYQRLSAALSAGADASPKGDA